MEIIRNAYPAAAPKAAIFDFDGTISLIVSGWREIMIEQFVAELRATPKGSEESPDELEKLVSAFVDRNTGRPTIYQSFSLIEEIRRRGGTVRDPVDYKKEHSLRMKPIVDERLNGLRSGRIPPSALMLPGSVEILKRFRDRDVILYLASGSSVGFVKEECELLGITDLFDGGIYGALPDPEAFSKAMVIERILDEQRISPDELIGFGDGHTETQNVRAVGGFVVGVASDETGFGGVDPTKRSLLIDCGSDVIIPDYRDYDRLMERFFYVSN